MGTLLTLMYCVLYLGSKKDASSRSSCVTLSSYLLFMYSNIFFFKDLVMSVSSSFGAKMVVLRQEHTGPTVGRLKCLERLRQGREQICLVCSAALEAFGACKVWGGGPSDVWATGFSDWLSASWMAILMAGMWEWRNTVCFVFLCTPFHHSPFSCFAVLAPD